MAVLWGHGRSLGQATSEFTGVDGSLVRCGAAPGACVVAIESGSGHLAAVPISFAPPGG
jgi:hypothetical protein